MSRKRKKTRTKPKKQKLPLTPAQRRVRKKRRKETMIIFINGKQKRVARPRNPAVDSDQWLAANVDPIFLHENECWDLIKG